jgi:hypothetical protein
MEAITFAAALFRFTLPGNPIINFAQNYTSQFSGLGQ